MANLYNPESGRTFVHEACLGNLMEWGSPVTIPQRRIMKAMLLSKRNKLTPFHFAAMANAVKQTMNDKTGKVGLTEAETIHNCLTFMKDPKVMRIIARATTKLHGVPFKLALQDLRGFQADLLDMVRVSECSVTLH